MEQTPEITINPHTIYSVADVAAYLKVCPNTVYALIRSGQLRARKLAAKRCIRIEGAAVKEYMSGQDEL